MCPIDRRSGVELAIETDRSADAYFPLTPALSLREREHRRQSVGESGAVGKCDARALPFLLPKGEHPPRV